MNDPTARRGSQRSIRGRLAQWLVLTLWSAVACLVVIAAEAAPYARGMAAMPGEGHLYAAARVAFALRAPLFVLAPFTAAFALRFCPGRVRWRIAIPAAVIASSLGSGFVMLTEEDIIGALAPEDAVGFLFPSADGDPNAGVAFTFDLAEAAPTDIPDAAAPPSTAPEGTGPSVETPRPEAPPTPVFVSGPNGGELPPGVSAEALMPPPEMIEALRQAAESQIVEAHAGESAAWHFGQHFLEVFVYLGVALVPALALLSGERERLRIETERELATTENHLLRAQLQPHFLFNALNGIQVLVDTDPERAKGVVQRLSGLLRATLREASQPLIPLAKECAILDDYLAIERLRFGDRIHFDVAVEEGLETIAVPSFSLQPLVENALRYGPGARPEGGDIQVDIRRSGSRLRMEVLDDGPGFPTEHSEGHGLGTLRRRLHRHFGGDASLEILRDDDRTSVVVTLPLAPVPTDA